MQAKGTIAALLASIILVTHSAAQDDAPDREIFAAPSAWDLELGKHAFELPTEDFIDYYCGTNGGPPSLPVSGWADYHLCRLEPATGLHEIYFQYDDENEYLAKAMDWAVQIHLHQYTSAYEIPVIASALFDPKGFLVGIRMVTDPRVPAEIRENGISLSNFLRARYGSGWACEDLPRIDGEEEFQGHYEKRRCYKVADDSPVSIMIETRNYRKPGQYFLNPYNRKGTVGHFECTTKFELFLLNAQDGQPREVPPARSEPTEKELLVARAMDCPGCDLRGANLKRANLRGANLSGANLQGANLHGAILAGADLSNTNLESANLNRADFKRANFDGANIQRTMMYESHFDGASLVGADLTLANAGRVQFIRANLTGARMVAMDLRYARMNDSIFSTADISGSLLDDAQLARSDLTGAIILQAGLVRASLVEANLTGADLRASQLINANLRGANLTDANFSFAMLNQANLSEVIIDGAIWVDALLPGGFDPN